MHADVGQTALDGSTVSASARLEIDSYAMNSVTTATATANAYDAVSYGGHNELALRQDSGADVTADSYVLAETGGLGNTANIIGAANGNSAQIQGYYLAPDQVADIDQDNRGDVTARAGTDAGGGAIYTTAVSSANGNSAWMQNEWGYGHIQGEQDNEGDVTAETDVAIGDFDIDLVSLSSEGVGNSAIISNIGADAYMGVDQTNNGVVTATTSFDGGTGGSVLASATAFGNAATTYVCSECAVTAYGNTNQTNNSAVNAYVTGRMNTGGHVRDRNRDRQFGDLSIDHAQFGQLEPSTDPTGGKVDNPGRRVVASGVFFCRHTKNATRCHAGGMRGAGRHPASSLLSL